MLEKVNKADQYRRHVASHHDTTDDGSYTHPVSNIPGYK